MNPQPQPSELKPDWPRYIAQNALSPDYRSAASLDCISHCQMQLCSIELENTNTQTGTFSSSPSPLNKQLCSNLIT